MRKFITLLVILAVYMANIFIMMLADSKISESITVASLSAIMIILIAMYFKD